MNGATPGEAPTPSLRRRVKTNGKKSAAGREENATAKEPVETRSLRVVLRAVERHQSRSLMLTRLAHVVLEEFHGTEGRPPSKLVRLPNGIRYAVEPDDSQELYLELLRMAGEERAQLVEIHQAAVQIAPTAVDIPAPLHASGTPAPPDEPASTVDNPAHRVAASSSGPTNGVRRRAQAKPDEWEQAVGANGASKV